MFYRLAKIDQNDPNFKDACESMGWEGDTWKEVWDELKLEDGFIVNYNHEVSRLDEVESANNVSVFCVSASRWFELSVPALVTEEGYYYVQTESVDEF